MFRIYLKSKVEGVTHAATHDGAAGRFRRNRRLAERFPVDRRHLQLMNDQDILVITDLSTAGFHALLADGASERFHPGDVFDVRLKARQNSLEMRVAVVWREPGDVGFSILSNGSDDGEYRRLIHDFEIAASLQRIASDDEEEGSAYFRGLGDTALHIWIAPDGSVSAWMAVADGNAVRWNGVSGFETGSVANPHGDALMLKRDESVLWDLVPHSRPDPQSVERILDIMFAWQDPLSAVILRSIDERSFQNHQAR